MPYTYAGILIALCVFSSLTYAIAWYLLESDRPSPLSDRIPKSGKELAVCVSGLLAALTVILLGKLGLASPILIFFAWIVCSFYLVKLCFLIPDIVHRKREK